MIFFSNCTGPSAIENIQRDEVVESVHGGGQEPGSIEISNENGNLIILQIQRRIQPYHFDTNTCSVNLRLKLLTASYLYFTLDQNRN